MIKFRAGMPPAPRSGAAREASTISTTRRATRAKARWAKKMSRT